MPKYTPIAFEINLGSEGLVFDVGSLFEALLSLHDQRDARGLRYALVTVLVFVVLAKLAGEGWLHGIAQWVAERPDSLAVFLNLAQPQAPHHTTYGRILARAINIHEFEQVVGYFFASLPQIGHTLELALDGKTLRGTIPLSQTRGVHLLAAYLQGEGLVLMQVAVDGHENEIVAALQVLKGLDLQGKIVTGDALLTQRKLAQQIVEAGGDYVLPVKDNQPHLRADIQTLFTPEPCINGFSPASKDFRSAATLEKGHGRLERRTLIMSRDLKGYVDWPYAEQVFQLDREFIQLNTGQVTQEVVYGISSLAALEADAARLLTITRRH